ncbi:hypothetical protein C2S53_001313 [Perilla frutescens var. hirtella]|uniref:DUF659 domain-containing protein n=1 Tax=Perilla frutescens var. hirtella TaxID=608512 RepID=A0AAD4P8T6_PERFH|nr:hypothetical protein C2S53_001313 [Perilla frutescens var. hirtella]
MLKKVEAKLSSQMMPQHHPIDDDEDKEDMETLGSSSKPKYVPPKQKMKDPLDVMFGSNPRPQSGSKNEKKTIFYACDKACRDRVLDKMSNVFYDNRISLYAATTDSYKEMIEEIRRYGPGLVPPSMYELRVHLLKKKVDVVNLQMLDYKKEWAIKGCSILFNGWRDSVANKKIVNFLINSPKGSVFLRSVDAFNITKDAYTLLRMLNDIIQEVGESNVIQVVTNNTSIYVKAGKMLMIERKHFYWTPCAAHCLDLILEDIGKLLRIKNAIKKCIFTNGYIYNHLVGPLVKVLRMVDGERKPAMRYNYEAMDRAKEAIVKGFSMNEEHYREAFEFIDRRWECQLHQPLHAAGYFLNLEFYYANPEQVSCAEVEKGLYDCIERLSLILKTQDKIMFELDAYKNASGCLSKSFGNQSSDITPLWPSPTRMLLPVSDFLFEDPIVQGDVPARAQAPAQIIPRRAGPTRALSSGAQPRCTLSTRAMSPTCAHLVRRMRGWLGCCV